MSDGEGFTLLAMEWRHMETRFLSRCERCGFMRWRVRESQTVGCRCGNWVEIEWDERDKAWATFELN